MASSLRMGLTPATWRKPLVGGPHLSFSFQNASWGSCLATSPLLPRPSRPSSLRTALAPSAQSPSCLCSLLPCSSEITFLPPGTFFPHLQTLPPSIPQRAPPPHPPSHPHSGASGRGEYGVGRAVRTFSPGLERDSCVFTWPVQAFLLGRGTPPRSSHLLGGFPGPGRQTGCGKPRVD